jgi:predicted  nucleic acid-binding Zn-ribbon protein
MPTAAESDRIRSVVATLQSLGNAQRGDLITAQRWNDLVSVVTSLAQMMLAAQQNEFVPPHEHPDQVKLSWLDPALRAMVEKGPSDPVKVVDFDHRVRLLESDLATVRTATTDARDRLAEISTRELVRDANISEVRRVVETIDSRKDAVAELRQTFDSIHGKVDAAIEAGSRFVIAGKPVDMDELDRRVKAVEDLRTSVQTNVTGFETRITDLQKNTVTQAQLKEAIGKQTADVSPEQIKTLQSNVSTAIRTEFNATFETLGGKIGQQVDQKLATLDATVVQRIDDRLPAAIAPALAGVQAQITLTAEQLRGESKTVSAQAAAAVAAAKQELSGVIATVQSSLTSVKKDVDSTLPRVTDLQTAVVTAQKDAASALQKTTAQAADIQAVKARAEQVALQSTDAIRKTEKTLLDELDRRVVVTKTAVDERFLTLEASIEPRIDQRIDPRFTSFEATVTNTTKKAASDAALAALASTRPQLDADITRIARDQALALKDEVVTQVKVDIEPVITKSVNTAFKKVSPQVTKGFNP